MNLLTPQKFCKLWTIVLLFLFLLGLLPGCNSLNLFSANTEIQEIYPQTEVIFQVILPAPIPQNSTLALEMVDDITGLAFNPTRYEMTQQDDRTYFVKLPLVIGSVLKYRYVRQSDVTTAEYSPQTKQVRFRLANITGPAIFQDNVAAWIDQPYSGPVGRVVGQFIDHANNAPIPNLLVTAEGIQTVTASDGTFILEGLTPGTHSLVAYSMDGQFSTFQQGVLISEEATTPVSVYLDKRELINVTFDVVLPTDFETDLPLRFATNMQSLGNAYVDLVAGSTTIAANLPVLTKTSTNRYSLSLKLPVGFDLQYKFTLGDGLWNSELDSNGSFRLRELIVPAQDQTISSKIDTFTTPGFGSVSFYVSTAANTPQDESVSIQFNPFGWFEPLPMFKIGENQWMYKLYSPMNILGPVEYRFCRNDLCEETSAIAQGQQVFTPSSTDQQFTIQIDQWINLLSFTNSSANIVTDGTGLLPRTEFLAGFEFVSNYSPSTKTFLQNGLLKIANEGANLVILSPSWSATRITPPFLEPLPGTDISWTDLQTSILQAKQQGMQVGLFPQINYPINSVDYWAAAKRDSNWWQNWFDRYHRYMIHIADAASLTGAEAIIVGDPTLTPSMTGGVLLDGNSSNVPANADEQWQQLILDLRARYSGTIIGVYSYPTKIDLNLSWLNSVDSIYVLYSPSLAQDNSASVNDLISVISQDLQKNLSEKLKPYKKPVIIGINYPSSANAFNGCTDQLGNCINNWGSGSVDFDIQSRIYNAAVISAAKEAWISGFISRGYQPIAIVDDGSASIDGKPAMDVLWFWYHFILNKSS